MTRYHKPAVAPPPTLGTPVTVRLPGTCLSGRSGWVTGLWPTRDRVDDPYWLIVTLEEPGELERVVLPPKEVQYQ